jgi:hypothetical protein
MSNIDPEPTTLSERESVTCSACGHVQTVHESSVAYICDGCGKTCKGPQRNLPADFGMPWKGCDANTLGYVKEMHRDPRYR